jgi:hypothetical protein
LAFFDENASDQMESGENLRIAIRLVRLALDLPPTDREPLLLKAKEHIRLWLSKEAGPSFPDDHGIN